MMIDVTKYCVLCQIYWWQIVENHDDYYSCTGDVLAMKHIFRFPPLLQHIAIPRSPNTFFATCIL